jgi:hypothetical protein
MGMQDRKGIERVVRCRDEDVAVVGLQHRRVAIAGSRPLGEVVDDQRAPVRLRLAVRLRPVESVRSAGAEVPGQCREEFQVVLVRAATDPIILLGSPLGYRELRGAILGCGFDAKRVFHANRITRRMAVERLSVVFIR